jgi:hypothetical protein
MAVRDAAARGLAAGFAGTLALTASQRIEMRITGRPPSDLPAQVAEGALGISARGRKRALVAFATHWFNNTSSGLGRAALGRMGLRGAPAVGATFVLYLGGGALLFRTLDLAPVPWRRGRRQLAVDAIHAGVYAVVTSTVYDQLDRQRSDADDPAATAPA